MSWACQAEVLLTDSAFHLRMTSEYLVLGFLFFSIQDPYITSIILSVVQKEKLRYTHRLRSGHTWASSSPPLFLPTPSERFKFLGFWKNGRLKNLISKYLLIRYFLITEGKTVPLQ